MTSFFRRGASKRERNRINHGQQPPSACPATTVPAVAGYKPGEIPPIPLFKVPPIGVFASNADKAVIDATSKISSVPGVTVAPAVCDGSGTYSNTKTFVNYNLDGKGGGVYNGPDLQIINNGDGTAQVNGTEVKTDKAPVAGKAGKFPKVGSLKPVESCGTTITLEDGVLFDFGKSDIRP